MRKALALCLAATPLAAEAQTPAPTVVVPVAEADAARLKLARALVAEMLTDASIQRMFGGLDKAMSAQMMTAMVPAGDLAKARAADPAFDERMRRVMKVTMETVREAMTEMMPQLREVMAGAFARHLSEADLHADLVFVRTPAGRRLFEANYAVMQDPAYAAFMQGFAARMGGSRGALIEKIKAATADLPPPPTSTPAPAK